jgi:hypothetical protein
LAHVGFFFSHGIQYISLSIALPNRKISLLICCMRTFQDQRDTSSKRKWLPSSYKFPSVKMAVAKFGLYYVRSAYKLACTESFFSTRTTAGRGSNSGIENQTKDWKKLWAIQAPNKMNILLWRMAHDCLPIGFQLHHKHIPTKDECIFCG